MIVVYGIKNCDSVKKARKFLDAKACEYRFHDVRADGLNPATIEAWLQNVSWEALVNTKSKTWNALPASEKQNLNEAKAVHLLCTHPTLMKRPVLSTNKEVIVGFDEHEYEKIAHEQCN